MLRMSPPYPTERTVALEAVRIAATVCQAVQANLVDAQTIAKKDRSPVTVADFASQAVVCAKLAEVLPNDPVVGEEGTGQLRQDDQRPLLKLITQHVAEALGRHVAEDQVLAWIDCGGAEPPSGGPSGGRYWTLDPIDGTKGFLRGEQYAIALALIEDGQVVLSVLGCPNLPARDRTGVLMLAIRGRGAWAMPLAGDDAQQTIAVSTVTDPAAARFCESVESGHSNQSDSARIAEYLGITAEPLRMDSQCKYAAVARGDASIYLRMPTSAAYREKIWDHAAGMLVVEEAGGRVTDVTGKPLDFTHGRKLEQNRGIIATNGRIHDAVVAAVQAVVA